MEATNSDGSPNHRARAEELLRAAGVLLVAGSFPRAVAALHAEAEQALGHAPEPTSADPPLPEQARERQARLASELGVAAAPAPESRAARWLQEAPTWIAWGLVLALALGFGVQRLYGVSRKSDWKDEFPSGQWIARYYGNMKFEGAPLTRFDIAVNHEYRSKSPAPGIPKDRWSARWDTCLVVTQNVELRLQLAADDSSRLLLDATEQISVGPRPGKKSASFALEPGIRLLTLELTDKGGRAYLRLDGLQPEGTESYSFQRPLLDGDSVHCE